MKSNTYSQKTAREWFEQLPDGYREQALKCLDRLGRDYSASIIHQRLSEALEHSFYWEDTPQGMDYWYAVYEWCLGQECKDSQLPELWVPTQ